ncbi:hypothetical protein Pelo_15217 [Pelomyxa schiedti]|nr:hypothetical protein Pelo_15217 [Pelomyxa schiedti]
MRSRKLTAACARGGAEDLGHEEEGGYDYDDTRCEDVQLHPLPPGPTPATFSASSSRHARAKARARARIDAQLAAAATAAASAAPAAPSQRGARGGGGGGRRGARGGGKKVALGDVARFEFVGDKVDPGLVRHVEQARGRGGATATATARARAATPPPSATIAHSEPTSTTTTKATKRKSKKKTKPKKNAKEEPKFKAVPKEWSVIDNLITFIHENGPADLRDSLKQQFSRLKQQQEHSGNPLHPNFSGNQLCEALRFFWGEEGWSRYTPRSLVTSHLLVSAFAHLSPLAPGIEIQWQECIRREREQQREIITIGLPPHIFEAILCLLPIDDLLNCRSVCSGWLKWCDEILARIHAERMLAMAPDADEEDEDGLCWYSYSSGSEWESEEPDPEETSSEEEIEEYDTEEEEQSESDVHSAALGPLGDNSTPGTESACFTPVEPATLTPSGRPQLTMPQSVYTVDQPYRREVPPKVAHKRPVFHRT